MSKYQPVVEEQRVFVTVKAYPQPSSAYRETVCVAGITDQGKFIRLFPVTFRDLEEGEKFKLYTWIRVRAWKTTRDTRPESYHIKQESIQVESVVEPGKDWAERWRYIRPLISPSLDALKVLERSNGTSLGIIKPRELQDLVIKPAEETEWSSSDLEKLLRRDLFAQSEPSGQLKLLEKIPFQFRYRFLCDDDTCTGHDMSMISWEVVQTYRNFRAKYPGEWEKKFRETYWDRMKARDLHFHVGNMASHRTSWLILGLFYPPITAASQLSLFDD